MSIGTSLYTFLFGYYVGSDDFKNRYYCNNKNFEDINAKRWVIFYGEIEATKIPPHWHGWLHKNIEKPPLNYKHKYIWQKNHEKNTTGTNEAYFPNSHPLSQNYDNEAVKKEYETWSP
tara:strand:+ start:451 stop:804 length:354 start_codon:yes stop_codon:yes gene_type:complete